MRGLWFNYCADFRATQGPGAQRWGDGKANKIELADCAAILGLTTVAWADLQIEAVRPGIVS
ncbi:MAG: hypothetical protein JSW21_10170 [Gammaproteobacteria bacterium]|nr:MAG: hypothetical protein JSW21_10170 [Gammaproteobacteria bacterium]